MRFTCIAVALSLGISAGALAQAPAAPGPGNSAVQTPNAPQPANPVAGANSFTEGQAKSRLESQGFSEISDLRKDDQGVWRGKAKKGASSMEVSVDFQGNVVTR
jgi:hypothetical protein